MKPIVFIFGPSGVGKSHLYNLFEKQKFLCMQIDTDSKKRTFAANGFPSEWDTDFCKVRFDDFVGELQERLGNEHVGFVVSFPTTHIFTLENCDLARQLGVTLVLLWGSEANCKQAAEIRINKKGGQFNLERYERKNRQTFQLYSCPEYDIFRLEVFQVDGSRFSDEELLKQIAILWKS